MRVALAPLLLRVPLAHRGYHDRTKGRIENAPASFRAAIEAGYGIELDVQQSADGEAIVFHDDTLERLTDRTEAVAALTATELGRVGIRGSADTIPTLAQVLALVGGRVPVLIEIKEQLSTMLPTSGRIEAAVARTLDGYNGPVAVMSFNPHCVAHMARLAPTIARGLTTEYYHPEESAPLSPEICARLREIPDYDRCESSFISHKTSDLGHPRVAALKAAGAAILTWTVKSPEIEAKARRVADNITFEGYPAVIPA